MIEQKQDKQDRKRQDKQDKAFYYPAYPAACDPAYLVFFPAPPFTLCVFVLNLLSVFSHSLCSEKMQCIANEYKK
jgi:hypothetical protein